MGFDIGNIFHNGMGNPASLGGLQNLFAGVSNLFGNTNGYGVQAAQTNYQNAQDGRMIDELNFQNNLQNQQQAYNDAMAQQSELSRESNDLRKLSQTIIGNDDKALDKEMQMAGG